MRTQAVDGGPAYIISAYHRPDLLFRLIIRLGSAPVAVHVDKRSSIWDKVLEWSDGKGNITLLPRHTCYWGLFGHVDASLEGLRWFSGLSNSHVILLTGQCYPLLLPEELEAHLRTLGERSVMDFEAFPKTRWRGEQGGYNRIKKYFFHFPFLKNPRSVRLGRRTIPGGLHPFGGAGYWCMSRAAASYVLEYTAAHPQFVRFFRRTAVPDETFFHTMLANSALAGTIENRPIHYFHFEEGADSPNVLSAEKAFHAREHGYWFARKFEDGRVLDCLDKALTDR